MTQKEKAIELVERFWKHQSDDYPNSDEDYHAKLCALICVDEIIHGSRLFYIKDYEYWIEVKQEINKM